MQNVNIQMPQKPAIKAPIITIVGGAGLGKTSLAAMFPNSVFMQAEESGAAFDSWAEEAKPDLFPLLPNAIKGVAKGRMFDLSVSTLEHAKAIVRMLATTQHQYKTLVIDTATTLNKMLEHECCCIYGVDNIAEAAGGFHKGYLVVQEWHLALLNGLNMLRNRGMTIVILAHQGVHRLKNRPDEDDYTVFSLDMHEKSAQLYVNLSDAVLYMAKEGFVKDKEKNQKGQVTKYGKHLQTGVRKIITTGDGKFGYRDAKTRYAMPPEIIFNQGENPLLQYINFFNQTQTNISE